jgi:hypothetical protein
MPRQVPVYRCLIVSPSDVVAERDAIVEVVELWNAHVGPGLDVRVEAVRWESHARPEMTGAPQAVLNRQLVETCDFGVAVFWCRLGTPTAEHPSGSAEEVERLVARGADVMVYFSSAPVPQEALKDDQFQRLQALKASYQQRGLLATYDSVAALGKLVNLHLTSLVSKLLVRDRAEGQPIPSTGTLTAPTPDVRVSVEAAFAAQGPMQMIVIEIRVENHSPVNFYFSSMTFTMEDLNGVFVGQDALTGEHQLPRVVEPGNSFAFHVNPDGFAEAVRAHGPVRSVAVKDKIGRVFRSQSGLCTAAFEQASRNKAALHGVRG